MLKGIGTQNWNCQKELLMDRSWVGHLALDTSKKDFS
jgi:hypothetical protein